ncbi:MAG: hypothetical protein AB1758_25670 [Candidatus Eremiobacterota bacterium]
MNVPDIQSPYDPFRMQHPQPAARRDVPVPTESFLPGAGQDGGLPRMTRAVPVSAPEQAAAVADTPPESSSTALKNRQVLVQDAGIDQLPCRLAGQTTLLHHGQSVEASVFRVDHPDGDEVYKIRVGDQMVGYIMLSHLAMEDGTYGGLESCPEWSPLARYGGRLYADKLEVAMMSAPGQLDGYAQIGTRLHQIAVERLLAEGCEGLALVSSWNSQGFHYKSGYRADDYAGIPDGARSDAYIAEQLRQNPEDPHTEPLGCIQMYLPPEGIERFRRQIDEAPILPRGEAALTDLQTGQPVTARVEHSVDPFGLEFYRLKVGDEVVGDVALNFFSTDPTRGYHDSVGSYGPWSPFARYGNGKEALFNADKVFLELDNSPGEQKYADIQERLYQIAVEASLARGCQGRLQLEGDWNEHGWLYQQGFRSQDFAGLTRAADIDRYIATELQQAEAEGRPPVTKGLGSINMKMPREQALAHWGPVLREHPILLD